MKIVIVGGSGVVGRNLSKYLICRGHDVVVASPSHGVNTITGQGLIAALNDTKLIIDASNSPSIDDEAVMKFFVTSTSNLLCGAVGAGVNQYVALSVVGSDRNLDCGYMRAKAAQEKLIIGSGLPYTIVRATQLFEFLGTVASIEAEDGTVHLSPARLQPVAAADVAAHVGTLALGDPRNDISELAGPEIFSLAHLIQTYLKRSNDSRIVIPDTDALFFGARLDDASLMPSKTAGIGPTRFEQWLDQRSQV